MNHVKYVISHAFHVIHISKPAHVHSDLLRISDISQFHTPIHIYLAFSEFTMSCFTCCISQYVTFHTFHFFMFTFATCHLFDTVIRLWCTFLHMSYVQHSRTS